MKRLYRVTLARGIYQLARVEINAEDRNKAVDLTYDRRSNPDLIWDDYKLDDVWIVECEEVT